jgi:hypothetical protein
VNHQSNQELDHARPEPATDVRLQVTQAIWGCATGMLGICIPLVAMTHSAVMPFAVIIGAALGTAAVWIGSGLVSKSTQATSTAVTQEQLKALEERLANMEAINLLEQRLNERSRHTPGLEPQNLEPQGMSRSQETLQNRVY